MIGIHRLNIEWKDDNTARIQDPDTGEEFNVTVRPKTNMFVGGKVVKPRLYVSGSLVTERQSLSLREQTAWAKKYFGPVLNKILNREVEIKFSSKAGCSCGCSPGFIVQDNSIPFDIWMEALPLDEED